MRKLLSWKKPAVLLVASVALIFSGAAFAGTELGIGGIAQNVTSTFTAVSKLITAASYVAGMGFAIAAILKFKAHKDNPTQIPVGTPIALLFIGAALLFMPSIFQSAGETLFGSNYSAAGVSGTTSF
ncbi:MAG: hypothetical protein DHS20C10_09540 [marine bacterium B5-7]|nr:MAG: hypothetical protein DHS20C10_09540 [marine bacterium B5-7]